MTDGSRPTPPSQSPSAAPAETPYRTPEAADVTRGPRTSGLAVAGFVLAFVPCVGLVGVILSIVALVTLSNRPQVLKGQGLAIAGIVIGVLWNVVGVVAAIAVPNYLRFIMRAKQTEAKSSLKSIYLSARTDFADSGRLGTSLDDIGWLPVGATRYTYYYGDSRVEPDLAPPEPLPPEVDTYVRPDLGEFRAVAVANLDSDPSLDVWAITDADDLTNILNDVVE